MVKVYEVSIGKDINYKQTLLILGRTTSEAVRKTTSWIKKYRGWEDEPIPRAERNINSIVELGEVDA